MKPFADDAAVRTIGGLTLENHTDRVSLSGSIEITRDRRGQQQAKALLAEITAVVAELDADKNLPETPPETEVPDRKVPNPFER